MKHFLVWLICIPLISAAISAAEEPPSWAYPVNPPDFKQSPDDGALRRVPDSGERFSTPQVRNFFFAPDWHPASHLVMPPIVSVGRKPDVPACGFCHRAEGTGGPENANIAGLPFDYFLQQIADYKSGARSTAMPNRAPQVLMIAAAKAASAQEIRSAAAYFSALEPRRNIRIVESADVPRTFVAGWFFAELESDEREPVGQRILEVPDNLEQFESRDTRSTFTAYVPLQSLRKGEVLVRGRDVAKAPACATCHGSDLRGLGAIPPIVGRSPTYVFRQLYEFQKGVRNGSGALPMQQAVGALDQNDMIAIAAYLGSLIP